MEQPQSIRLAGGDPEACGSLTTRQVGEMYEIAFCYRDRVITRAASDYFDAFCAIRLELEVEGLLPICYGASLNVFPSGMTRDMAAGLKAYRHTLGRPARMKDLVSIFDEGGDVIPATVAEQRRFFDAYCESVGLRRRGD